MIISLNSEKSEVSRLHPVALRPFAVEAPVDMEAFDELCKKVNTDEIAAPNVTYLTRIFHGGGLVMSTYCRILEGTVKI